VEHRDVLNVHLARREAVEILAWDQAPVVPRVSVPRHEIRRDRRVKRLPRANNKSAVCFHTCPKPVSAKREATSINTRVSWLRLLDPHLRDAALQQPEPSALRARHR
jgi:hypothetical protein